MINDQILTKQVGIIMKNRSSITIIILFIANISVAQEGFYLGAGVNLYNAWEEVSSTNQQYNFSHSTKSSSDGFLTQSLVKYGPALSVGYRYNIDGKSGRNLITLDAQYYFNYQEVTLNNHFEDLEINTKLNNNHGFRLAIGHHFGVVHPYIIVQAIYQRVTPEISIIDNGGVIYDVEDNGEILDSVLAEGDSFRTFAASFLGGFGIEVPLKTKLVLDINYVPMKHVEYGLKDVLNSNLGFSNSVAINSLQIGIKYFPFAK